MNIFGLEAFLKYPKVRTKDFIQKYGNKEMTNLHSSSHITYVLTIGTITLTPCFKDSLHITEFIYPVKGQKLNLLFMAYTLSKSCVFKVNPDFNI